MSDSPKISSSFPLITHTPESGTTISPPSGTDSAPKTSATTGTSTTSTGVDTLELGSTAKGLTSKGPSSSLETSPPPSDAAREAAALARFRAEMPIHEQGQENSCGTTSLAMAMAYLGVPADFRIIDRSARMFDPGTGVGTSPADMVRFARRAGLQAQHYNDASITDLEGHVRAGRPVTVLLNFQREGSTDGDGMAHYVNVIGFQRDASGTIQKVIIVNPWGVEETLSYDNFMSQWSNVSLTRSGIGAALPTYNRTMIVLDRPENPPLPSASVAGSLRAATTNNMLSGLSGLSAGVQTIQRGHAVAGGAQILGSGINMVVGGAGFVIGNLIGQNLERGGEAVIDRGLEMMKGGFFAKIGGFFALLAGGILKAIGSVLSMAGGALAEAGRQVASPLTAWGESASRRDETREMLLNTNRDGGVEDPSAVLARASTQTKAHMLDTLLKGIGAGSDDDQRAALVVLRSASPEELATLAEPFGGPAGLLVQFSGDAAGEVANLYGLPTPADATGSLEPEPSPA